LEVAFRSKYELGGKLLFGTEEGFRITGNTYSGEFILLFGLGLGLSALKPARWRG